MALRFVFYRRQMRKNVCVVFETVDFCVLKMTIDTQIHGATALRSSVVLTKHIRFLTRLSRPETFWRRMGEVTMYLRSVRTDRDISGTDDRESTMIFVLSTAFSMKVLLFARPAWILLRLFLRTCEMISLWAEYIIRHAACGCVALKTSQLRIWGTMMLV